MNRSALDLDTSVLFIPESYVRIADDSRPCDPKTAYHPKNREKRSASAKQVIAERV